MKTYKVILAILIITILWQGIMFGQPDICSLRPLATAEKSQNVKSQDLTPMAINGNIKSLETLGQRVRALRETKGWSLAELEVKSGIRKQSIWKIEIGRTKAPHKEIIQKLAKALEVDENILTFPNPKVKQKIWREALDKAEKANTAGERIGILREAKGLSEEGRAWSMDRLAEESKVSAQQIWKAEAGRVSNPSKETIQKLAKALGVNEKILTRPSPEERRRIWREALAKARNAKTLGERICILRKARGIVKEGKEWPKHRLAQEAELSRGTVEEIEDERVSNPLKETIQKLAKALGVNKQVLTRPSPQERRRIWREALANARNAETLGERICILRKARGIVKEGKEWTQDRFAEETEISQRAISLIERNKEKPTNLTLEKIASALGVKKEFLTFVNPDEKNQIWQEAIETVRKIETLNERVKILRQAKGWFQKDLATKSGLSEQYICRLEKGKSKNISYKTLQKLAKALEVDIELLMVISSKERRKIKSLRNRILQEIISKTSSKVIGYKELKNFIRARFGLSDIAAALALNELNGLITDTIEISPTLWADISDKCKLSLLMRLIDRVMEGRSNNAWTELCLLADSGEEEIRTLFEKMDKKGMLDDFKNTRQGRYFLGQIRLSDLVPNLDASEDLITYEDEDPEEMDQVSTFNRLIQNQI